MIYAYGYSYPTRIIGEQVFNPANLVNTQFYSDPTIASSINGGSPSDTDPVSILGDLSAAANDGTQGVAINQPVWNTTHVTYATNDTIIIDDVLTDIAGSTQGTIEILHRPVDGTPISNEFLIGFGDANASSFIAIIITTAGMCRVQVRNAGVNQWILDTDAAAFTTGVWTNIILDMDGISAVLYVDNVAVAQTFTTSTDKTHWFSDIPLLDTGRIGGLNFNSGGDQFFVNGDIQQVYMSTDSKDAATRTNLFNHNQP